MPSDELLLAAGLLLCNDPPHDHTKSETSTPLPAHGLVPGGGALPPLVPYHARPYGMIEVLA